MNKETRAFLLPDLLPNVDGPGRVAYVPESLLAEARAQVWEEAASEFQRWWEINGNKADFLYGLRLKAQEARGKG